MLALLGGPALLSAFTVWKFPALLGEISAVNSEIPPKRAGAPHIKENKF